MDNLIKKLKDILQDESITNYRLAKETGISQAILSKYSSGESNIEKMGIGNALKIINCYDQLKGGDEVLNTERDMLFGRLLGSLNMLSKLVFEKGKPSVFEQYGDKFAKEPSSVLFKMHQDVMEYSHTFGKVENEILDNFTEVFGQLDADTFNDKALGNSYLLGYYKQQSELKDIVNEA